MPAQCRSKSRIFASDVRIGVKDDVDCDGPFPRAIATKADAIVISPSAPALPPVAGDQQARHRSGTTVASRQFCFDGQQRIDTGIARDVDFARDLLGAQVGCGNLSRCKQQVGVSVDGDAIFLFGPGEAEVVRSEARLDMRDRDAGGEAGQRAAERAGGVALHDEQIGPACEQRPNGIADAAHVRMRIGLARTAEIDHVETAKPEIGARPGRYADP